MRLKGIVHDVEDWINLAQDNYTDGAVFSTAMNLQVQQMVENSLTF
jgi:hypothetical protein